MGASSISTERLANLLDDPARASSRGAGRRSIPSELQTEEDIPLELLDAAARPFSDDDQFLCQECHRSPPKNVEVVAVSPRGPSGGYGHQHVGRRMCQQAQPCPFRDREPSSLEKRWILAGQETLALPDQPPALITEVAMPRSIQPRPHRLLLRHPSPWSLSGQIAASYSAKGPKTRQAGGYAQSRRRVPEW